MFINDKIFVLFLIPKLLFYVVKINHYQLNKIFLQFTIDHRSNYYVMTISLQTKALVLYFFLTLTLNNQ